MRLILASLALALAGCAAPRDPVADNRAQIMADFDRRAAAIEADVRADHYPERRLWTMECRTNPVTNVRICSAKAAARHLDENGQPYGDSNETIYINYVDGQGPSVLLGAELYPGSTPIFRIDEGVPILVDGKRGAAAVVEQMRLGKVLRAQFLRWPSGSPSIYIELAGAPEALAKLDQMRKAK